MHKLLFYNKFIIFLYMFRALLCLSSGGQNCIILYLVPSHSVGGRSVHGKATDRYDDTRCCIIQFDLLTSIWCSKHVEAYNKLIIKQEFVH